MNEQKLERCHMTRDVLISRLEYFANGGYATSESKDDLLREALAHLLFTHLPDNCANNDCPYQRGEPCPATDGCGGFTPDNKELTAETNADRIRAMTDEELAVTLMCPNEMGMAEIPCDHSDDKNCCECLLRWLSQPAEED